jgi:hypothetical protein
LKTHHPDVFVEEENGRAQKISRNTYQQIVQKGLMLRLDV